MSDDKEIYCGSAMAAHLLGISVISVQKLVDTQVLRGWKTSGGHRRISLASIAEYQRQYKMPVVQSPAQAQSSLRLLVVDDNALMREMMAHACERFKPELECTVMGSAVEALIGFNALKPDVFITDLNMPGMDGFELLRLIDANPAFRDVLCVAISALSEEEILARGGLHRHVLFVPKPLNLHWFDGFLTAQLQSRRTGQAIQPSS